jgi:hypothetical protein
MMAICVLVRIVKRKMLACTHHLCGICFWENRITRRKDSYATEFARKGGKARAAKLTDEQRKESARKAAQARWAKKRTK